MARSIPTSIVLLILFLISGMVFMLDGFAGDDVRENIVLGIHGGIGLDKVEMTPEIDQKIRAGLKKSLEAGKAVLDKGGTSLDAIEAAIHVLEDDPVFNAGRGAVFTHEGRNELDSSIMDGATLKAGAVAGVSIVRHPISAARAVMEKSKHVMMIGRGAEVFATQQGLEIVDPSFFWTEDRWKAIQEIWKKEEAAKKAGQSEIPIDRKTKFGTVGAVALDQKGNLAAGTSTGGMTNKMYGRVGDTPIIGAGTYADNSAAAISCTGHGEYFIRYAVSHEVIAQIRYKNSTAKQAADDVVQRILKNAGGEGGMIVLDPKGRFATSYNTDGMYRASITKDGQISIRIYEN